MYTTIQHKGNKTFKTKYRSTPIITNPLLS